MSSVSSVGSINVINGGLDVQSIVDSLMTIEHQPVDNMQTRKTDLQNKVTAFQSLNTKVSTFLGKVNNILYNGESVPLLNPYSFQDRLSNSVFAVRKVVSSNDNAVSATATKGTASGNYAITVTSLAQAKTMASANFADTDTTSTGTGNLVITVGSAHVTVTIDSSNDTLSGVRDAINAAGAGVTASIVNDGSATPYRLVISANETGTANAFTVTNGLSGGTALSLAEMQSATDAEFTVNSINVTRSSNTINDVINGVTFELKDKTTSAANLSVTNDADSIVSSIQGLASAYNDLNSFFTTQFQYNSTTKTAGLLAGDFTVRDVQSQIQSLLSQFVSNAYTAYGSISQIGLTFNNNGSLNVDESKLRSTLSTNFTDVAALMLGNGNPGESEHGTATDARVTYLGQTDGTKIGTYDVQVTSLAQKATVVGQKALDTLDSGETLTITHGSTVTTVDLLANDSLETVLSKITSALAVNHDTVTATDDGSHRIKISTNGYGSAEMLSVTSSRTGNPDNSTGFGNNPDAAGTDIAGTINDHAAVGAGLTLTGAAEQPEAGISLQINQTTTGGYGTVTVVPATEADEGSSIIVNLETALKGITDPLSGPIQGATDSLNSNIRNLQATIADYEARLVLKREILTQEYARADQALRLLNVNQASLTSQTNSLSSISG